MEVAKKITVEIPPSLLKKAQKVTGTGITATIRKGLEFLSASEAYEGLRQMRGKVRFSIDLKRLRED